MLATFIGAMLGHYDREFKLTMSQRTLMLQTISFLVYLELGAAVFAHIEGWNYLDALYWADFTLLTVGIGDYSPMTHLGRGLLFPFAIGGIIIIGLVIGSIRSLVLERGKVKLGARMVEKERRRILQKLHDKDHGSLLSPITSKDKQQRGSEASDEGLDKRQAGDGDGDGSEDDWGKDLTERQRREKEFALMRKVQSQAASRRRWTSLGISGATWFVLWFAGAAIFQVGVSFSSLVFFRRLLCDRYCVDHSLFNGSA